MAQNACVTRESIFFLSLAAGNQTHMCNIIIVRQRNTVCRQNINYFRIRTVRGEVFMLCGP